jgi:hypothetical protein
LKFDLCFGVVQDVLKRRSRERCGEMEREEREKWEGDIYGVGV